jgi:hypothetical protein
MSTITVKMVRPSTTKTGGKGPVPRPGPAVFSSTIRPGQTRLISLSCRAPRRRRDVFRRFQNDSIQSKDSSGGAAYCCPRREVWRHPAQFT